jgi:DNA-binding MarR family transcriptional regulator
LAPELEAEPPGAPGLKTLGEYLLQDPLKNSVRVLMLISLGINHQLSFTELLELTGISKGSLSHHLDQLSAAGLTRSRMVFTLGGPRVQVEITPLGLTVYQDLTRTLAGLAAGTPGRIGPPSSAAELSR